MTRVVALAAGALLLAAPLSAAAAPPIAATGPLRLELPLLDVPYDTAYGWRAPSMAQAEAIARDFHTTTNWAVDLAIARACEGRACGRSGVKRWVIELGALALANAATFRLPLFSVWSHEEWHRVVLGQYGIDSRNDTWDVDFTSSINVSHVTDDELIWLKRNHPGDMVRLATAGMEGDIETARAMESDAFFDHTDWRRDLVTLGILRGGVVRYMWFCDSHSVTTTTDHDNAIETDPAKRDVVGYDCDSWAYDVQRPDEPYEARGPHPTGIGIDRYRKPTQLTDHERSLLFEAKWLSVLNLVDPAMFGVRWHVPRAPAEWSMTGGLAYEMTSFGQAITLDLYGDDGADAHWRAAVRAYLSEHLWLPGLELERVRLAARFGGARLEVTPGVGVWLQPASDRWDDTAARPGAVARLKVAWVPRDRISAFAEVLAKTPGWVAGTPSLGAAVEGRVGVGGVL